MISPSGLSTVTSYGNYKVHKLPSAILFLLLIGLFTEIPLQRATERATNLIKEHKIFFFMELLKLIVYLTVTSINKLMV